MGIDETFKTYFRMEGSMYETYRNSLLPALMAHGWRGPDEYASWILLYCKHYVYTI